MKAINGGKMKEIRLIELFAGIGSQTTALKRLGVPHKRKVVEFDKYAIDSYNAMHGTHFECSDVKDIHAEDLGIKNTDKYTYCLFYSFPCTDLSIAGQHKGMSRQDNTRSGLLWEVERILLECEELGSLPQILLMENVPNVHGKRNIKDFEDWIGTLEYLGYKSAYKDLNAKDFGIPQSRNRCFMVSILNGYKRFKFPKPFPLDYVLRDFLEDKVEGKYYLQTERAHDLIQTLIDTKQIDFEQEIVTVDLTTENPIVLDIANCITSRYDAGICKHRLERSGVMEIKLLGNIYGKHCGTGFAGNVWDKNALAPTLMTMQGGNRQPCILETKKADRNLDDKWVFNVNGNKYQIRVRKLTPKECFRLMGFIDEEFERAEKVNSNTQLYKQIGNSIVVSVLEAIFYELFKDEIKELRNEQR